MTSTPSFDLAPFLGRDEGQHYPRAGSTTT
jgi:hypothetical protein